MCAPLPRPASTRQLTTSLPPPTHTHRRFQWYCRFYQGRRSEDDERQLGRWLGVAGPTGRWKNNLIAKCVAAKAKFDDPKVSPVVRQTLHHWGYALTEADFEAYAKKVRAGAGTAFVKRG
jgi:hypothetical protein